MLGCCPLLTALTVGCGCLLADQQSSILGIGRMQQNCCCFNQKVCSADLEMTRAAVYLPGASGVTYSTPPITVLAHLVLSPAFSRSATSSLYTPLSMWQSTMSRCAASASAPASVVQAKTGYASQACYSLLVAIVEVAFPLLLAAQYGSQLHHVHSFVAELTAVCQTHLHRYLLPMSRVHFSAWDRVAKSGTALRHDILMMII